MKKAILILLFSIAVNILNAQSDSNHWEAKLIVRHPFGYYDTLIVGADVNGAIGIQPGMDIMNTNFSYPVSIRGYDSIVYQQYNTCPANMKKDIRAFDNEIIYSFYIKADSFPEFVVQPFPPDSMITILYDTADFNYSNKDWILKSVIFYSLGGYMEAMDGDSYAIKDANIFGHSSDGDMVILYEQNPPEYFWGSCNNGEKVIRFDMVIRFDKTVGIEAFQLVDYQIYNNSEHNQLNIKYIKAIDLNYTIIDLNGKIVQEGNLTATDVHKISYQLIQGIYILVIQNEKVNIKFKFIAL